jgi:glyceraldehyde-3-phosphate dehydrogenase (NAD(P))
MPPLGGWPISIRHVRKEGVKAIFQGGEDLGLAGVAFNAFANYNEAWGAQFVRVVSCNTTGLIRTLYPLDKVFGIEKITATLVRRGADPADNKGSALNSLEPSLKLPTHHGPDVQTIMPWLNITTMSSRPPPLLHSCIIGRPAAEGLGPGCHGGVGQSPG